MTKHTIEHFQRQRAKGSNMNSYKGAGMEPDNLLSPAGVNNEVDHPGNNCQNIGKNLKAKILLCVPSYNLADIILKFKNLN